MAERMHAALADLLRDIGRMDRRLDALQAAETGTGGGGGAGTVTSVGLSLPAFLTVSGSPVTTAGTLTAVLATQAANRVMAGPTSGGAAAPTFRALVAADIPALPYGTGTVSSVGLALPAILTVSGSPVTTAGTLTAVLAEQAANVVFAGPVSGVGTSTPTFRALVAADLPAGTGTVTSVALSLPAFLTVSGSPVTTAGTLTAVLAPQAANLVWAGPASGAAAAPTFRALVAADLPAALNNAIVLITADRTALVTDRTILADPTAGNVYIRLPAAASMANVQMWIKRRVTGSNLIYLVANALETIEHFNSTGAPANAWQFDYIGTMNAILIQSDGSVWRGLIGAGQFTTVGPECDIEQPAANPVASGGTVAYGTVVVGVGSAKTFTVKNTGVANLGISAAAVAGGDASDFAVNTSGMASVVAGPAGSTTFVVTFTPAASGARSTTLTVTNTDASEGSYTITLTGTGSGAAYDWAPWAVYTMASMQAGAQAGAGDNGISWFNQAT